MQLLKLPIIALVQAALHRFLASIAGAAAGQPLYKFLRRFRQNEAKISGRFSIARL
jgi:hypothetical protein